MLWVEDVIAFTLFACWGSFLNVIAYRLIRAEDIISKRSSCTQCQHPIAWYDLIPILSWFILRGRCRNCHSQISPMYPLIEATTALIMFLAWSAYDLPAFSIYFVYISALIVSIRTDLEEMVISSYASLGTIPVAFLGAYYDLIPLTVSETIVGAIVGYALVYIPARVYRWCTGIDGMGEGDFELLACIGAFSGVAGAWTSLMIGSLLGSIIGLSWMLWRGKDISRTRIPFGPFLAAGGIIYLLGLQTVIHNFF